MPRRAARTLIALTLVVSAACSSDDDDSGVAETDSTTAGAVATDAPDTTSATGSTDAPVAGGTVSYGVEQEYTSYNNDTGSASLFANTEVLNVVQPTVYTVMPDLSVELNEELVTSVEVTSEDPQVVVYELDPDAAWEDGDPIDCDDFHLEWLAGNGRAGNRVDDSGEEILSDAGEPIAVFDAASTAGYEDIDSLDCSADGTTITTTYAQSFVDYPSLFANLMPAHVVERETGVADVTADLDPLELQAVGEFWSSGFEGFDPELALSGSWYDIDSVTPGESVVLVRNAAYWGTPGLVDEIVFRLIPSAPDLPAALGNGDVQVIAPQPEPDLLDQLGGFAGLQTEVQAGTTFEHLDFNQAHPLLADVSVRRAIALCIDREELVVALVAPVDPSTEVLGSRVFVPFMDAYADNSGDYGARDVERAKALLEDAGYTLGSDGVYERDGERLSFRVGRRDPNPRRQSVNELIGEQCREAGIELVDDPSEDFNSVRLPASDYDIALFAWVATPFQSSNTSIYSTGQFQNWNHYSNPDVDALFVEANAEFDPVKRAELMNEIDRLLWEDMATLPLFQQPNLVSTNESVVGVVPNDPLGPTWNANVWAIR